MTDPTWGDVALIILAVILGPVVLRLIISLFVIYVVGGIEDAVEKRRKRKIYPEAAYMAERIKVKRINIDEAVEYLEERSRLIGKTLIRETEERIMERAGFKTFRYEYKKLSKKEQKEMKKKQRLYDSVIDILKRE